MFFQYILLGMLAIGTSLDSFDHKLVKPRAEFKARYYFSNNRPMRNNLITSPNYYAKSYITVNTVYTILKVLDLQIGMQGWATQKGFVNGVGGGYWGATLRVTNNLSVKYKHFSCHVFDSQGRCGSEDSVTIRMQIGFDNKGYGSISDYIFN